MTDVIKVAKERRERLAAEITKLDDFIRMAEALVKWNQSKGDSAAGTEGGKDSDADEPLTLRPSSSGGG